jgi:hypothetical protein
MLGRLNKVQVLYCTFKGTQAWDSFEFFGLKSKPYMTLVNNRKKCRFFSIDFYQNFCDDWAYSEPIFLVRYMKNFFKTIHFGPIRWAPWRFFSKFRVFIIKNFILIGPLWLLYENYSMGWLSICRNDFIAHWAYSNEFSHLFSKILTVLTWTSKPMLSQLGNDFIACWVYVEMN